MANKSRRRGSLDLFRFRSSNRSKTGSASKSRRARLESLEERQFLSATPLDALPDGGGDVVEQAPLLEENLVVPLATTADYNAFDLAKLQAIGLTPTSSGVVWSAEGRLVELNADNLAITEIDLSGCDALKKLYCRGLGFSGGELQTLNLSGCANLQTLLCSYNRLTNLDVSGCVNLKTLDCFVNALTSLDVSDCVALQSLDCGNNALTSLVVSNCANLKTLDCYQNGLTSLDLSDCANLQSLYCYDNALTSLDVSDRAKLRTLYCHNNALEELDVSGCSNLRSLKCYSNALEDLGVSDCANLQELYCDDNDLTSLDVSELSALRSLDCRANNLTSLDVSDCANLQSLVCDGDKLTSLDVSDCANLQSLVCDGNKLTSLVVSGLANLQSISCVDNSLTSLDVSGCARLLSLLCAENSLSSLVVSGCANLQTLECDDNALTSLDVSDCVNLKKLYCGGNALTSLDVSVCANLQSLFCEENALTSLDVSESANLQSLRCYDNALTSLDVSNCSKLLSIYCYENALTGLDVSERANLQRLYCYSNNLTSLNVSGCANLQTLHCSTNALTSLDVSDCEKLLEIYCSVNALTSLDVSNCAKLTYLSCNYNNLTSLDVSGCEKLATLNCRNIETLTSLDVSNCLELGDLSVRTTALSSLDLTNNAKLYRLIFDAGLAKIAMNREGEGAVLMRAFRADDWDALVVLDGSGTALETTIDGEFINFSIEPSATDPIAISYQKNGTVVARTTINETRLEAPAISSVATTLTEATFELDSVANAANYVVEFGTDPTFANCSTENCATPGAKTISGLESGTTYYFRVKATADGYGDSDWTTFEATTLDPSVVPLDVPTIAALSGTKTAIVIKLDAVEGARNYVVEYATDPSFSDAVAKTYSSAGTKTISGLSTGTWYCVRVKATATGRPDSVYSETRKVYTGASYATPSVTFSAVTTAVVLNIKPGKIDAVQGAPEKYVVEYSESPDFSNAKSKTISQAYDEDGTLKPCKPTISGLTFGTIYYFRVKAIGSLGNDSGWNNYNGKTIAAGQLAVPTFFASKIGADFFNVRCYNSASASGFEVMYSTSPDFSDAQCAQGSASSGIVAVTGLDPNAKYYFKVRALGDNVSRVDSSWSSIVGSATTKAAPTSSAVLDSESAFENYFEDELDDLWEVLAQTLAK